MQPDLKLDETTTPDGGRLTLYQHGSSFCIRLNGLQLMNSAAPDSELRLGEMALRRTAGEPRPRILIGGLGLGFTLKSVLAAAGPGARIQVVELIPAVVEWNRRFLLELNGALLDDPRVQVLVDDLWEVLLRNGQAVYDALVVDVDNGPKPLVYVQNARLYSRQGLRRIRAALKAGRQAVFWSADPAPAFATRLLSTGFRVKAMPVRFQAAAQGATGMLYVAEKVGRPAPSGR